jgi:hypothetical protein
MTLSFIGLPIRLGLRGAGMAASGVATVADHALGLIGKLAGAVTPDGGSDVDLDRSPHEQHERRGQSREDRGPGERTRTRRGPAGTADRPPRARAQTPRRGGPRAVKPATATESAAETDAPAVDQAEAPAPPPTDAPTLPPLEDTPPHVSEEPTLVEELAETGAEDGAGAEVRVAEPWDGYRELSADDIIDRIAGAATAELAAVELYEQSHRRRRTVLVAVERELRRAAAQPGARGGGGAPDQGAAGEPQ